MKQRLYILLLSVFTCVSAAWAQSGYWTDINFATFEDFGGGEGTEANPYVISSPEHLAHLAYLVNNGTDPVANLMKGKYFVQRADIDLSAHLWEPIGKDKVNTFLGNYNGMGHTIKGMRVEYTFTANWPVQNGGNSAPGYGLFGSVNGIESGENGYARQQPVIQNVVLVNPVINIDCASNNKLVRTGLIVGALGSNSVLRNSNVQNGSITIQNLTGLASGANMFIGGAVGDCAPGFGGSAGGSPVIIKNISVDANIMITPSGDATEQKQGNDQYCAGGIVGRMRFSRGPLDNCYYSGQIDAPQFIVSPSYGAVRNTGTRGIAANFAGIFYDAAEQAGEKVYFGDYQVKYKDQYRTITGNKTDGYTFTPADDGTSTLTQGTANGLKIWSFGGSCPTGNSSTEMYRAQGVNSCDTYVSDIDTKVDGQSLLDHFNDNVSAEMKHLFHWVNHTGKPHLHRLDDATMDSTTVNTDYQLKIVFNDTEATGIHYHWTKTINGNDRDMSNDAATITIPEKTLANVVWSAYVSYQLQGDTSDEVYHSNVVTYHQPKNVGTFPTVTVSPSVSGNTLTLTATLTDPASLALQSITYHWFKDGVEQAEHSATLTTEAYTTTDIEWEVYATFSHNDDPFETERAAYTQTKPAVTYTANENGEMIDIALAFETYGGALTNVTYYWDYNVYDENGDLTKTISESKTSNTHQVSAVIFEERIWHLYVKYEKDGVEYQSESVRYPQPANTFPVLSVSKDESDNEHLVMQATLTPAYTTITTAEPYNLKFHWSKDGVEQTVGDGTNDVNDPVRIVPHAFDTQYWRCWATFTVDGKEYRTNEETYIYYSTLGHLEFTATAEGNTVTAKFKDGTTFAAGITVVYTYTTNTTNPGESVTGNTFTTDGKTDWVEFKATITDGKGGELVKTAFYRFVVARNVVYINYTGGGNDLNDGMTRETPVRTWERAYSLLDSAKDIDHNIIVIVNNGTTTSPNMVITEADTNNGIAATITGQWPWTEAFDPKSAGRIYISAATSNDKTGARIGASTKFKNVVFYATGTSQNRFSCFLHDTYFDTGVVMQNFAKLETNAGLIAGRNSPHFHLQLYGDQWNSGTFPQAKTDSMRLTIKSGQFGRILASRIAGTKAKETYIIGRHDNPVKAIIDIDIQDPDNKAAALDKNGNKISTPYTDDIGYIAAGLTQGMMYGDIKMNITGGTIGTLVAASQGNALKLGDLKVPVSTFCGRTTININAAGGDDGKVVIQNYYGGCQGRVYGSEGICDAYLYGKSTLNLRAGTIKANVFASSAGISGLRSTDPDYYAKGWYTPDQRIPYPGTYAFGVDYLPYDRSKKIVGMTNGMAGTDGTAIDLSDTEIVINISGGIVEGSVYGGSYGYSDPLNNVSYAPANAGRLFGNTSVNISGGTIYGSVYGGGAGSTGYYNLSNTDALRQKFTQVAQVYGNTNVTITGGSIDGNIYGGGGGVPSTGAAGSETEFLDIAKVYGNTNVTIDAAPTWEYRGNIYGGGAKGAVEGTTNVTIVSGTILGNVYGGGQGEDGHPEKAKVLGGTKVVVGE